jgi:hypothetical protein
MVTSWACSSDRREGSSRGAICAAVFGTGGADEHAASASTTASEATLTRIARICICTADNGLCREIGEQSIEMRIPLYTSGQHSREVTSTRHKFDALASYSNAR